MTRCSHTSAHQMNTEECPEAPVEDILCLERLGGGGAQMKGLLQGAEITRFPCVGMVDPPRGGGSMEMRQPLAEGPGSLGSTCLAASCCRPLLWEVPNLRPSHRGLARASRSSRTFLGGPPHTEKGCWRILFSQRYVFLKTSNSANNNMVTKSTACGSPGQTQNCDHAGDCEGVGGGRGRDTSRLQ